MAALTDLHHGVKKLGALSAELRALPLVSRLVPGVVDEPDAEMLQGFVRARQLAERAAQEIAGFVVAGWTELQAADLLTTYLRDCGADHFSRPVCVWFGERARLAGVGRFRDCLPSPRSLHVGEIFIFDVAPVLDGCAGDFVLTSALGPSPELAAAKAVLADLRAWIPTLFRPGLSGGDIWRHVDGRIAAAGFDNIHAQYAFSALGYRLQRALTKPSLPQRALDFATHAQWRSLTKGVSGNLLHDDASGDLRGLWSIAPHIGGRGFGAKFSDLLLVDRYGARWCL